MALRTGTPQRVLAERFTVDELRELFAVRKIEFESTSKEDVRAQAIAFYISHAVRGAMGGNAGVRGMKAEHYAFNWGGKKNDLPESKVDHDIRMLLMAAAYGGTVLEDGVKIPVRMSKVFKDLCEKQRKGQ